MESGGGGLVSTLHDYSHFAQGLACGYRGFRLLGRKTLEMMYTNQLPPDVLRQFSARMPGYGYGCGVRTLMDKGAAHSNAAIGEFGWGGAAGSYIMIDPDHRLCAFYAQHMLNNQEPYVHPRLRNLIYQSVF